MWYCYIIKNDNNLTYNGYTTNLFRRLRQHNGLIAGGAKATANKGPWSYYCILTGFDSQREALSCEWKIKHPTGKKTRPKKYCGIQGRILSLNQVLSLDTWTSKSSGLSCNNPYTLYLSKEYINIININNIKNNVTIKDIDELTI